MSLGLCKEKEQLQAWEREEERTRRKGRKLKKKTSWDLALEMENGIYVYVCPYLTAKGPHHFSCVIVYYHAEP